MIVSVNKEPNAMRGMRTHFDLCVFRNPYATSAHPKRMKSTMRESQNRDFVRYVRNIPAMVHLKAHEEEGFQRACENRDRHRSCGVRAQGNTQKTSHQKGHRQ